MIDRPHPDVCRPSNRWKSWPGAEADTARGRDIAIYGLLDGACNSRLERASVRRRQFIHLLGIAAAWPLAVQAQKRAGGDRVARIGVLWHAGSEDEEREYYSVLMQAFKDLGYVEGKNAEFLHRYPAERIERFEQLAKDLVDSRT